MIRARTRRISWRDDDWTAACAALELDNMYLKQEFNTVEIEKIMEFLSSIKFDSILPFDDEEIIRHALKDVGLIDGYDTNRKNVVDGINKLLKLFNLSLDKNPTSQDNLVFLREFCVKLSRRISNSQYQSQY